MKHEEGTEPVRVVFRRLVVKGETFLCFPKSDPRDSDGLCVSSDGTRYFEDPPSAPQDDRKLARNFISNMFYRYRGLSARQATRRAGANSHSGFELTFAITQVDGVQRLSAKLPLFSSKNRSFETMQLSEVR